MQSPETNELRLWLAALPPDERSAMLHALVYAITHYRDDLRWQRLRSEACRAMSDAERRVIADRGMRIAVSFEEELAAARAA